MIYQVTVGLIEKSYDGEDREDAMVSFGIAVYQSRKGHGNGSGQDVTLTRGEEVIREYISNKRRRSERIG